uniref:Nascent polypeptide-associated complex protein n=1 Tax=Ignisphaera aggregans TaxID=334771 RepID=A0A7C2Z8N0_9CREN
MFYIVTKDIREEALTIEQALAPNVDTIPSVVNISDEDIQFVAEYAGVSKEKARDAIFRAGGDIAKAIELLEQEKRS